MEWKKYRSGPYRWAFVVPLFIFSKCPIFSYYLTSIFLEIRYFRWSSVESKDLVAAWDLFFRLNEMFNENAAHIVEPHWCEWIRFSQLKYIDFSWAYTLLTLLLAHENPHVKKFAFNSLLACSEIVMQRLSMNVTFITGILRTSDHTLFPINFRDFDTFSIDLLIPMAEDASLYRSTGLNVSESLFGMTLVHFLTKLSKIMAEQEKVLDMSWFFSFIIFKLIENLSNSHLYYGMWTD